MLPTASSDATPPNGQIRAATQADAQALWAILEPVLRAGETYPQPMDLTREQALAYWFSPSHRVFVYESQGAALGTYYIKPNQQGNGDHVANFGFMTAPAARGRGVGRAMALAAFSQAKQMGFRAVQFNFVISANAPAVHLWQELGLQIVGTLPGAFLHPRLGEVDAYVMFKRL